MLYIVLLHYPVYNKKGEVVTTAIANIDLHDIARVAKTYDVDGFYIVNPIDDQRRLAQKIVSHWMTGFGADYNKSRSEAFALVRIKKTLAEVLDEIERETSHKPKTVVTGAGLAGNVLKFSQFKDMIKGSRLPFAVFFGSGFGIAQEVIEASDFKLEPITGKGRYNHLSVRSAVAIVLDRINR